MAQVGPFFDKDKLAMWLYEMVMRVSHAAMILTEKPEGNDLVLLATQQHYLTVVNAWWAKYRNMKPQAP